MHVIFLRDYVCFKMHVDDTVIDNDYIDSNNATKTKYLSRICINKYACRGLRMYHLRIACMVSSIIGMRLS